MRRILLPTLEGTGFKGGVARYIDAISSTYPEIRVHEFKKNSNYFDYFWFFLSTHGATDIYFIHHILPIGTVAAMISTVSLKPYVIFLHGMDFDLARRNSWKRFLTYEILRRAKRIVVNSEALQKEVMSFMGNETPLPLVVYPTVRDTFVEASRSTRKGVGPVDLQELAKLAAGNFGLTPSGSPLAGGVTRESDESLASSTSPDRGRTGGVALLTVARLVERKGHLKVLEVLERMPGVKYHIVGDGELRGRLEAEIMHRGLSDRVTITTDAKDEDLPKIYSEADIFVMPTSKTETDREGFGIVYLEAQLFGLPVVATRYPGVDEAVKDGETGILVEDAVDALEEAVKRLSTDVSLRSRLGSRGRERVLSEFTREKQMEKLRDFFL